MAAQAVAASGSACAWRKDGPTGVGRIPSPTAFEDCTVGVGLLHSAAFAATRSRHALLMEKTNSRPAYRTHLPLAATEFPSARACAMFPSRTCDPRTRTIPYQ